MVLKLCFTPHNVMILVRLVWSKSSVTQSEAKLDLVEDALNSGCRKMAIKFFAQRYSLRTFFGVF